MKIRTSNERGSILLTSLMILGLLALTLLATLNMVSTQRGIVARTQKWNLAIPMCEAGLEDAMAHINYSGTTNLGSDGWTLTTNGYFRSNTVSSSSGYYSVTISAATPPVITSQGFIYDALKSNYIIRTVQVNTKVNGQFPNAILAKNSIGLSGGGYIDSFNSSDPTHSTGGVYDSSKAESNAKVESTGASAGIIAVGTGKIYGSVDTAPGGTVTSGGGGVGDAAWLASNSGIEANHETADVNTIIPDVTLPSMTGALTPTTSTYNGTNYTYYLNGATHGYVVAANFQINGGQSMCVSQPSVLYATNGFTVSGSGFIYIAPGGSLQIYVGGPNQCTISGSGIVNDSQNAANCQIWGLPTLTTLTYSGSASYVGTVYAPEADCTFSGSAATYGAVVGKSFTMSGAMNMHYDEALGGPTGYKYLAASWQEQ